MAVGLCSESRLLGNAGLGDVQSQAFLALLRFAYSISETAQKAGRLS